MGCLLFYFVRFVVNWRCGDSFYSVYGKGFWRVGGGERCGFLLMVEGIAETLGSKIEKSDSVERFAETLGNTKIYWQCRRVC